MKGIKSVYWISTGLFSLIMLVTAWSYLASGQMKAAFSSLASSGYFSTELAVAKFAGVIGLLLPVVKGRVKEWVYAGFTITLCSGVVTRYAMGHADGAFILPLIMLIILTVSYITYCRLNLLMKRRELRYPVSMRSDTGHKRTHNRMMPC